MNMDIVATQEDTKTNIQLMKDNKPTPWLIGAVVLEAAVDIALAYGAFKLFKLFSK